MQNIIRKTIVGIVGVAMTSTIMVAQAQTTLSDSQLEKQKQEVADIANNTGLNNNWGLYKKEIENLVKKENTEAMLLLADFYKRGISGIQAGDEPILEKDDAKASELIEKAAKLGNKKAKLQVEIAEYQKLQNDFFSKNITAEKMIAELKGLAGKNNSTAMVALAKMYEEGYKTEDGKEIKKDETEAKKLIAQAAALGNPDAIELQNLNNDPVYMRLKAEREVYMEIAKRLESGNSSTYGKDIDALKKLAENGNSTAMVALATMYVQGNEVVEKDDAEAKRLIETAASLGNLDAIKLLTASFIAHYQSELREVESATKGLSGTKLERKLIELSQKKNTAAMLKLAYIYQEGKIVKKDEDTAAQLYQAAALSGNIIAGTIVNH